MNEAAWLLQARRRFHANCLARVITESNGIASIADSNSKASREISSALVPMLGPARPLPAKPKGQSAGAEFERVCSEFLADALAKLRHLKPCGLTVARGKQISEFDQYAHLDALSRLSQGSRELKALIGEDYLIQPDIVVVRFPEGDDSINLHSRLVCDDVARRTSLRAANGAKASLHASISCKLTIRSDRVQNTRLEALNLMRNRKGRVPHIVAVTAEPTPGRIAAIALGTGDVDCVYHIALPELLYVLREQDRESLELLETMIEGQRLRDIADLPLDLLI